jgi:glycolate oxidase FAD binding subunit
VNGGISIAGMTPAQTLAPADRRETAALVRDLYAAGRAFAFVGGGTELGLGNAPRALDAVVRTTALDRVIDYSPEDQTITVEAGMRIAAIDAVLAQHAQLLPLDAGDRRNATIGGAIAANAFGARRHRYGSIKDFIVGIEIVRPDGVVAHGGGKVVKNVAGFDLPKLMVGSLGTLGGILSATLRVFPRPAATQAVLVHAGPASAWFAACLDDRALEPVAVVHYPALDGVVLTFAGVGASVEQQIARVAQLASAHATVAEPLTGAALDACAALESAVRTGGAWRWTLHKNAAGARKSRPAPVTAAVELSYPTFGVCLTRADDDAPAEALLAERGRSIVFHAMPQHARGRVDAWGEPPASFPLMRALKENFDPKGLCNPGRFVGGL